MRSANHNLELVSKSLMQNITHFHLNCKMIHQEEGVCIRMPLHTCECMNLRCSLHWEWCLYFLWFSVDITSQILLFVFVSSITSVAPGGASYGRRDLLLLIYPSSLLSKSFPLMDFLSNHVGSSIPPLWFILHFSNVLNHTKHIYVMLYPKIKK